MSVQVIALKGLDVFLASALNDNYCFCIRSQKTGIELFVDPATPDAVAALRAALPASPLPCVGGCLVTHHHADHVGGLSAFFEPVWGSRYDSERARIPHQTSVIEDGIPFTVGDLEILPLETPGHTLGAVSYAVGLLGEPKVALFPGDTLFLGGCGRLFEGTASQMRNSLHRLAALPEDLAIFCAHEYTMSNRRFALQHSAVSADLLKQAMSAEEARLASGCATLPGSLERERALNPFLRTTSDEEFAALRRAKDRA